MYDTKELLIEAVGSLIVSEVNSIASAGERPHLLLSGGSTPGPVYTYIHDSGYSLDNTIIGLLDERFVERTDMDSNERLINRCFNSEDQNKPEIIGLVHNIEDRESNLAEAKFYYEKFSDKVDIVVLGMGTDGHTASIFPNDPNSIEALLDEQPNLYNTNAPSYPSQRITCSLGHIISAKSIYLIITGETKYRVLNESTGLPIHKVLERRPDIKIFYTDA